MSDEQSKLNRLERRLYSRVNPAGTTDERTEIPAGEKKAGLEWESEPEEEMPLRQIARNSEEVKKGSFLSKFFVLSILFFIISIGIALVVFLGGFNLISPNNVDISVLGPVSVSAGDELSLDIIVKNNNTVDLENVVLTVHYPDGTRSAANIAEPVTTDTEQIGAIAARQSVTKTVKVVLFGEKDTVQNITVTADYKVKLSTAPHQKEKQYEIAIKSAPVIMSISYPKEINSGHEAHFDIDITSNTNSEIDDVILVGVYPFGFTFDSSNPAPYSGNNIWHLGKLEPLEKRRISVIGTLTAQNNEERTFNFSIGTALPDDDRKIGVTLSASMQSITVIKPEIGLSVLVQGKEGDSVVNYTDLAQVAISWINNLSTNLENVKVDAKISGNMFDESKVNPGPSGFYRSLDDIAYWDRNTLPALAEMGPGAGNGVMLGLLPLRNYQLSKVQDPQIVLDISVSGSRLATGGVPEVITSKIQKIIKIQTEAAIFQRLAYSTGPFKNSGPVPPKVDTPTTYTVIWNASNSFNTISGGKMTAVLPPYVEWKGAVSPSTEKVSFDPNTRIITWSIGTIPRGTGTFTPKKEVAFQVGLVPSINQLGSKVIMVEAPVFSGQDTYTKTAIDARGTFIDTHFSEPDFPDNSGTVVN